MDAIAVVGLIGIIVIGVLYILRSASRRDDGGGGPSMEVSRSLWTRLDRLRQGRIFLASCLETFDAAPGAPVLSLHIGTELRQLLVSGRGNGLLFRLAEEIGVERSDQIRNLKAYLEATQGVLMGKPMTGYDYIDLAANKHDAHFPPTDDAGHDFLSSVVIGGRWRGSTRLVYDLARWTVTLCDWLAEEADPNMPY